MGDSSFTTWPPPWQSISQLEPLDVTQNDVSEIRLTNAGDAVVASYIVGGLAKFVATRDLAGIDAAIDSGEDLELQQVAQCEDAVLADAAFDGALLYVICVGADGAVTLRRAPIDDLSVELEWEEVPTLIDGAIDSIDLEASPERGVSIALRQGARLRVYTWLMGEPSFDGIVAGEFDHVHASEGIILAVCDQEGEGVVRTFVY